MTSKAGGRERESYQIHLIRIVRLTNKAGGRPEGESYHIQPIIMVRLTIARQEGGRELSDSAYKNS